MIEPLFVMSFMTGFLGSGHCLGMCGALVAALSVGNRQKSGGLPFHLTYNAGRTLTYAATGALAGWLGAGLAESRAFAWPAFLLLILSDLFVIAIGLGTTGFFRWLDFSRLEWTLPTSAISRLVRRLAVMPSALAAFPLGLLMGFIPCGFLYAMLLAAAQSGSAVTGALTMFAFGLGTVPALLLFGSAAHLISSRIRSGMLRAAGGLVVLMGCYNLYRHLIVFDWLLGGTAFSWCCFIS